MGKSLDDLVTNNYGSRFYVFNYAHEENNRSTCGVEERVFVQKSVKLDEDQHNKRTLKNNKGPFKKKSVKINKKGTCCKNLGHKLKESNKKAFDISSLEFNKKASSTSLFSWAKHSSNNKAKAVSKSLLSKPDSGSSKVSHKDNENVLRLIQAL